MANQQNQDQSGSRTENAGKQQKPVANDPKVPERESTPPGKGGGAGGYDPAKEQQEVNKERDKMHNERDLDQLNVEEQQNKTGNENPEKKGSADTGNNIQ
jgi:hypothetical protein